MVKVCVMIDGVEVIYDCNTKKYEMIVKKGCKLSDEQIDELYNFFRFDGRLYIIDLCVNMRREINEILEK